MGTNRQKVRPQGDPPTPLRAARLLRGFEIEDVARFAHTSRRSLERYEAGAFPRDLAVVKRLAELYEMPVEDLWPSLKVAA